MKSHTYRFIDAKEVSSSVFRPPFWPHVVLLEESHRWASGKVRRLWGDVHAFLYSQCLLNTVPFRSPEMWRLEQVRFSSETSQGDFSECHQEAASAGVNERMMWVFPQLTMWASPNRPASQYSALCSLQNREEHRQGGLQHMKAIALKNIEKTSIKLTWQAFDPFVYSQKADALSRTWR